MSKPNESDETSSPLAPWQRLILSIGLMVYLAIVLLGPLSNPISSKHLSLPLAKTVRPAHEALFLGHGYRFFGPDPGPSHIVQYTIITTDNQSIAGKFPDRESHWPRLLYHRWFMLSEIIFADAVALLEEKELAEVTSEMNAEIEALRMRSETEAMRSLISQREEFLANHEFQSARTSALLNQLANYLLQLHDGKSVEIFLRERRIAGPAEVASRIKLTDKRYLSEPRSLGKFQREQTENMEAVQ